MDDRLPMPIASGKQQPSHDRCRCSEAMIVKMGFGSKLEQTLTEERPISEEKNLQR